MISIKEVVVVEGIRDEIAVKRGVNCEIIYVSGFGISEKTFKLIEKAQKTKGVILFMDSDSAGERIRDRIAKRVKGVKHAYISRDKSTKNGDIGVEYAKPNDIIESIKNSKCIIDEKREEFSQSDLIENGLINKSDSSKKREMIGDILGIGYSNGKKFLSRLNSFNITREEFLSALKEVEDKIYGKH